MRALRKYDWIYEVANMVDFVTLQAEVKTIEHVIFQLLNEELGLAAKDSLCFSCLYM